MTARARWRRLFAEWIVIFAVAGSAVVAIALSQPLRRVDNLLYDRAVRWRAPPIDDRILIVAIDDQSLRTLGRWPWRRDLHRRMIERLRAAGAAAIAYDVLFVEPSPEDAPLAAAMKAGPPTLVPLLFEAPGHDGAAVDVIPPVAPIARDAAAIGHVALVADSDGMVRRAALRDGEGVVAPVPHLMELAYRATTGHRSPAFARDPAGVPLIAYAGTLGAFPTVPFSAVLAGEVPARFIHGRTVLIGGTAEGMGDRYPAPLPGTTAVPGIEIQANLLNGLLADKLVATVAPEWLAWLSLAPLTLLMIGFWRWRPAVALRVSIVLLVASPLAAVGVLLGFGVWFPPSAAVAGLLLVYPLWGWRRLQAVSSYVDLELARFAAEPDLSIPAGPPPREGDLIAGQTARLAGAIDRMRDVRRFAGDTVEGLPDPLLVTDLAHVVTLANGAAVALAGADPAGRHIAALLAELAVGQDPSSGETTAEADLVVADGRRFVIARAPFADADGRQRGWIVRLADISAIRAAEQARDQMLELLSHDMRSPQASIIASVNAMTAAPGAPTPDMLARITRYARQTLSLADNFVQLARIAATPFDPEDVAFEDVLAEAIDDGWALAKQRGVRIERTGADDLPLVRGEPSLLRRALLNLIDNAVSFSPAGAVVHCAIDRQDGFLLCRVSDDGPGIAPELVPMLFERFASGPRTGLSSTSRPSTGRPSTGRPSTGRPSMGRPSAGLGLAFVKATADRHGGWVRCDSILGEGATFTLALPVAPPAAPPISAATD